MLRNVSYNNPEIKEEIDIAVGKSYPVVKRVKMKGIGSPKYLITSASERIMEKLSMDNNLNYCSLELRPKGIIMTFRSILETFGWILPFESFEIRMNNGKYEIRTKEEFVSFENTLKFNSAEAFLHKIIMYQNDFNLKKTMGG
jgi:hypothetical protein